MLKSLTQEELKKLFIYDPINGSFTRIAGSKYTPCRIGYLTGEKADDSRPKPYKTIMINRVQYRAHRLAWLYMTGEWPSELIDHANGDHSDNRFSNLRLANKYQNAWNKKINKNNTSGYRGVSYVKARKQWVAAVRYEGKEKILGFFDTAEDAWRVRDAHDREFFGEFYRQGKACTGK